MPSRKSKTARKPRSSPGVTIFGSAAMLQQPVVATYIAAVSNAWALIETVAADFMSYLISEPYLSRDSRKIDPLGKALYGQLPTFRQRWAVLGMIIDTRLTEEDLRAFEKRRKALNKELLAVSGIRNALVHSVYGNRKDHDGELVRRTPYLLAEESIWEPEIVDPAGLKRDVERIEKAREMLRQFILDVQRRKYASPPTTRSAAPSVSAKRGA